MRRPKNQILWLLLSAYLILNLWSCSANDRNDPIDIFREQEKEQKLQQDAASLPDTDPWNENPELWGSPVTVTLPEGGSYSCHVPEDAEVREDTGIYAKCSDGQIIILGAPDSTMQVDSLEDVFPACQEEILETLQNNRSLFFTDYRLFLEDSEQVQINEKQMHKVLGEFSYRDHNDKEITWQFIGFATELSNGRCVYYMAAQRQGSNYVQLKRLADNLAYSFQEGG